MCACVTWFFQPWCIQLIWADLAQTGGGTEILLGPRRHTSLGPRLHGYHCYHTGARQTWKEDNLQCRNITGAAARTSWFDSKGHREAKRLILEMALKGKTKAAWVPPGFCGSGAGVGRVSLRTRPRTSSFSSETVTLKHTENKAPSFSQDNLINNQVCTHDQNKKCAG